MRSAAAASERVLGLVLLALLVAGIALSISGRRLPEPLAADDDAADFSAGRALRILERIARRPRPVGSEEHECVREILLEELELLGQPEQQEIEVLHQPLTNLLLRVPGSDPTGTVLCLAHYDSVPTGPGAGDDGVGVVAWLESLRALRTRGWLPRNDVVLLLSDGEELGLLGAHGFAEAHALAESVRVVVNLEAIGNGGAAVLFELGPRNGARVREFARVVEAPTGTSLSDAVYGRMPNDTDLSVFLRRGVAGFNLAITAGSPAYHAPHDTPAHLDPRSLQHMGECALALAERLGEIDLATLDGDDATFFDLLGRVMIVYPRAWDAGFVLVGLALAWLAWRRAGTSARELVDELARHALELALLTAVLGATWWLLDRLVALVTPQPGWVPGNTTSGALLFAGLVLAASGCAVLRADRESRGRRELAALVAWSAAALLAWLLLPGASFAFTWPLVAAALGALASPRRALAAVALPASLVAALLVGLPILHVLLQLFQRTPLAAVILVGGVLVSGTALFAPHFRAIARAGRASGIALLLSGSGAMLASVVFARALVWRHGALWP